MSASPTAKLRKRAERAEAMVVGMGFLLMKLQATYGADFGVGMDEQVRQAIKDYREICQQQKQREDAALAARGAA